MAVSEHRTVIYPFHSDLRPWMIDSFSQYKSSIKQLNVRLRPYHVEYTSSRPITEVKQRRARLVLGWVTAWEYRVS